MLKIKKSVIALILTVVILVSSVVPVMATSQLNDSNAPNSREPSYSTQSSKGATSFDPEPRPANEVRVEAWEKKPGLIRCTVLNSGIDQLDNVKVYIQYANSSGYWTTATRNYGSVGFFPVWEEINIGTDWTSATAYWTITDGGETLYLHDAVAPL